MFCYSVFEKRLKKLEMELESKETKEGEEYVQLAAKVY